jgi:hypothetical protein
VLLLGLSRPLWSLSVSVPSPSVAARLRGAVALEVNASQSWAQHLDLLQDAWAGRWKRRRAH